MLTWPLTATVWFHQLTPRRTKEAGGQRELPIHTHILHLGFKYCLHITVGSLETLGNPTSNPADPQYLFLCSKITGSKCFPVFLITLTGSLLLFSAETQNKSINIRFLNRPFNLIHITVQYYVNTHNIA